MQMGDEGTIALPSSGHSDRERFKELQKCILKCLLALSAALIGALIYQEELIEFITRPHITAMTELGLMSAPGGCGYGPPLAPMLKLALIVALFVSSPLLIYELWAFVGARLDLRERRWLFVFAPLSFLLFMLGCVFGYLHLISSCLVWMAKFTLFHHSYIGGQYFFTDYLDLVMMLTIILGAVLQIPLVMVFLTLMGSVAPSSWNRWRKVAILINAVFAAVVTPPDATTMLMVLALMHGLYEVGVLISGLLGKRSITPQTR